ncbi:MAG: nucleotide exchange factor GrpE [Actinomyces sp.]|uniref:nucleotide exchange factor GrpE n=1 Tax=Actinomyces sp. TaxID=29317 RepID=UPI0026DCF053|nr:nucleotide exchange factor GrpE [Actinomyces sp.]MDO4244025.1 nucleotide exchange factor GrpE [Actinomyces sp.]
MSADKGAASPEEPVDPELAEAVDSAFDGVVLDESGEVLDGGDGLAPATEIDRFRAETDRLQDEAARTAEDLARARADLYNLQQEYQGFVRRSRDAAAGHREAGQAAVVEALIPVLDEIALADEHGDLTGPFATTAGKLEQVLADRFGLERFGAVGEAFDPTVHEALMATESDEVSEPSIMLVLQPGYRLGERVLRAARVQVANPA